MSFIYSIIVITVIVSLVRLFRAVADAVELNWKGKKGNVIQENVRLPIWKWLQRYLDQHTSARKLEWFEFTISSESENEILITLYGSREVFCIDLHVTRTSDLIVKNVRFFNEDEEISSRYGIKYSVAGERLNILISPWEILFADKIIITLDGSSSQFSWEISMVVEKTIYTDYALIKEAERESTDNNNERAVTKLLEYEKIIDNNPFVHHLLYSSYKVLKKYKLAEKYFIRAMLQNLYSDLTPLYHELQVSCLFLDNEYIEKLRDDLASWQLDDHYGTIVLEKYQEFTMGLDSQYLKKYHEVLLIKRTAAGRMLTQRQFDFSSSNDILLHTQMKIIFADGSEALVPMEQFTVFDSPDNNIYLTTIQRNRGAWLLPELSSGDIVEWRYDLLCKEQYPGQSNLPHPFILANFASSQLPTLDSTVTFSYPETWNVGFAKVNENDEFHSEEETQDGITTTSYSSSKLLPTLGIYGDEFDEPMVACATTDRQWSDIGKLLVEHNLGEENNTDELPTPLKDLIGIEKHTLTALEDAFYWIRDRLKYGAVESGSRIIGKPGRAKQIIEKGIGDCKDKSYLLYQVTKALGLRAEYVAVNASGGLVVEELPADQFDHVFLRVQIDEQWIYLDASNHYFIFGFAPPNNQGEKGLVLNEIGEIITIPEDSPYVNNLLIEETLERIDNSSLTGTFNFTSIGQLARMMDENWKATQMGMTDTTESAQLILRKFMPYLVLENHERSDLSSHSNVFQANGSHRRGRLDRLGDKMICTLNWLDPILPIWDSIGKIDKQFSFYVPETIDIKLILGGELFSSFDRATEAISLENELCDISGSIHRTDDTIVLSRRIVIKRKKLEKMPIDQLSKVTESIDKAMRITFSIKPKDSGKN